MKRLLFVVLCVGLLSGTIFANPEFTVKPATPLKGVEWIKGTAVDAFKPGQIYVVEFWATWCPPCKKSIPHLTELQKHYKDKKVTIIGISTEPVEKVKPFVEEWGEKMDYTIAADTKQKIHEHYMKAYGARGIPHAFIVDGKGKLVWHGYPVGEMDTVLELVAAGTFDPVAYAKQKAEEEAKMKKLQKLYGDYFEKLQAAGPTEETGKIAKELIEIGPAGALNSLAWDILTRIEKDKRDLETALAAAMKANDMTEKKDPSILDTYALALFETGKVDEAIKTQKKAIEMLPEDVPQQAVEQFTETLKRYKAAKTKV